MVNKKSNVWKTNFYIQGKKTADEEIVFIVVIFASMIHYNNGHRASEKQTGVNH